MARKTKIMDSGVPKSPAEPAEQRAPEQEPKTEVHGVDTILRKGAASYFRGFFNSGGHLILTERSLTFKPHALNIKRGEVVIPMKEIVALERRNSLGVIPNGFGVVLRNGTSERFVVYGREEWIQAIIAERSKISKPVKG